jgi:hypothetical protein
MKRRLVAFLLATLPAMAVLSQNIGIGNTNPQYPLDLSGRMRLRGGPQDIFSAGIWLSGIADWSAPAVNQIFIGMQADSSVGFYSAKLGVGWGLLFDGKSGNVGIGTTTPSSPLSFANTLGNKISLYGADASNQYGLGIQGSLLQIYSAGSGDDIAFGYGSSTNFTECMRIKGDGNVGIGIAAPSNKLSVSGNANFTGNVGIGVINPEARLDVGGRIRLRSGGDASNTAGIWLYNRLNMEAPAFIGMQADNHVGFYGTGTGWGFVMNTGTGNIGVGTTTASTKLEVNGFTKMGTDAPAIKVKKLTGTTAATEGESVVIPLGLVPSKILSVSVLVEPYTDSYAAPSSSNIQGVQYNIFVDNNTIRIINILGNSRNILSKPFKVLITYEE